MRVLLAILGVFLLSPPPRTEGLTYGVPGNPGTEEVDKAVRQFAARCKGYGYKGIHAIRTERAGASYVQVTCETGITPAMQGTLNAFAELSGSSVEIRFPKYLSDVESEQYGWAWDPAEDRAPEGTKWFRPWNSEAPPLLLRDKPRVTKSEILQTTVRDAGGREMVVWELSRLKTREIHQADRIEKLGTPYLLADGFVVEALDLVTTARNDDGQLMSAPRASFSPTSRITREVLLHPLPFALYRCEVADRRGARD
jgi:hypothetical protein